MKQRLKNQIESLFFEKINNTDKLQSASSRKKGTGLQSIKSEMIMTDTTEIQLILRDYYEQLYANKMDNLEETDKFLEMYTLPRLNQEEIENMNGPVTSNDVESVI